MGVEVLEAGVGGHPLLLVHGFTGAKEDFADALPRFAEAGYHAVAVDLRGHGAGPHPGGQASYSLALFASDIVAFADRAGWDRFVLLGHSMGGMAAQLVALEAGHRLRGLVLMNTGHGPVDDVSPDLVSWGRSVVQEGGMPALLEAYRSSGGLFGSLAHQRVLAERPGYGDFGDRKLLACSPYMWLAMSQELLHHEDRLDRLASVQVPTLVVVGDQDETFFEQSQRLAKVMPDARLAVVAEAGHAPQFEQPDEWWRAVAAFLEEIA